MEGQVWRIVEGLLWGVQPRSRRFRFGDAEILRVVLWAVLHDRPMVWACRPEHWPGMWRPARLPHPSTISRRWRSPALQEEARRLSKKAIRRLGGGGRYVAIDGRPLGVGGCSKDPDARAGRGARGMARGYKMYAVVDRQHVILAYQIHPMSMAEQTVALSLLPQLPPEATRVVGDKIYDSLKLHRVAAATGRRLYTPLRENRVGRRQQPRRLQLLRLLQRPVGRRLMLWRMEIERTFGNTTTVSFGFKGLPAWARRLHRVDRWMWGKTLLHHAWLLSKRAA
jgi:hypothetical protein